MGFATGTFFTHAKHLDIDPLDVGLDFSKMPNMGGGGGGPLGLMTAGAECFSYLGAPCDNRLGSHIADDYTYVQAIGDDGQPVPNGEWGRLVVTTFGRDNFLIRYDLEEAAKLDNSDCGCGATSTRGWWGGRFKDLIATQGRSFMLGDIERALGQVSDVRGGGIEYVVVRPAESAPADELLRIRVEVGDGFDGDKESVRTALVNAFDTELAIGVDPEVLDREALPRAGYKATRVVDA
jgi:phenylacetate-CoA ligase